MKSVGNPQFVDDFLRGQKACARGDKCPANESREFIRGFNAQYEREQVMTFNSLRRDKRG